MNIDSSDTGYTVRIDNESFQTTKKTLAKLPSFRHKFQEQESWATSCRLDTDPKIFRHVLNVLRDSDYVVPNKYLENVIQAFRKNGADYYEFVGRPAPAVIPYVLRYDLNPSIDGVLGIPNDCVSSVLEAWLEVTGNDHVDSLFVSILEDNDKKIRIAFRQYTDIDLASSREITRLTTRPHQTFTKYRLNDLQFSLCNRNVHITHTTSGPDVQVKFCVKVV